MKRGLQWDNIYTPTILKGVILVFKLHCDSINMMGETFKYVAPVAFKFHCDSINMEWNTFRVYVRKKL